MVLTSSTSSGDAISPVESIRPANLRILADRMLRIQGYTDPQGVRRPIRKAAEEAAATAEGLLEPDVRYRRIAVHECTADELHLAGGTTLHCPAFPRFLGKSPEVVVFALTAGGRIDEELERLNGEEMLLEMLFLETAGWLGVEEITKAFTSHLRAAAKREGLTITRRMGPGYSYASKQGEAHWPLEDQQSLFALLDGENMPITVLESCAMLPKMSRSGLIGLVPANRH
jgi:hypothetical protein